jgi:hypothetical protein
MPLRYVSSLGAGAKANGQEWQNIQGLHVFPVSTTDFGLASSHF